MERTITELKKIVSLIRMQDYTESKKKIRWFLKDELGTETFMKSVLNVYGQSAVSDCIKNVLDAFESGDMVLMADIMEAVCIPALERMGGDFESVKIGDYSVEKTLSGYLTVKDDIAGHYLHSNTDPMEEARALIERIYDPDKSEYVIWGCGFGYHAVQFLEQSEYSIRIRVYDEDIKLIEAAGIYGVYSQISKEYLELIPDPNAEAFLRDISNSNPGIFMHFPSIKKIKDEAVKDRLYRLFLSWNGTIQLRNRLAVNFRKNVFNCDSNVCEIAGLFSGNEVVIVAGGPSVNTNEDFLKESKNKNRMIISVTTSLKRLADKGIIPDYAIVMDSNENTYAHMNGLSDTSYPIIVDSTAYWRFAENHFGKKYLALQNGYERAEKLALKQGVMTFDTGGSVTTLALSLALQFKASAIFLVGADMAFKDGQSHAEGTSYNHRENEEELIPVKGVDGTTVYTTMLLDNYRRWIETKIKEYPDIPVYNMSTCGAYISGTKSF